MQARKPRTLVTSILITMASLLFGLNVGAQQMADSTFNASVEHPAYVGSHPKVVIDEAHSNFHTADGRYKPFADLLRTDGYRVARGTGAFQKDSLAGAAVLVIANALAPDATEDSSGSAFSDEECRVVKDWVRDGGSLLLIADHTPFGAAAEKLAGQFGVETGKGFVFDLEHCDEGNPTSLIFSRENELLGEHPILRGRNQSEEVGRVVAFTGQSLGVPAGAIALLKLGAGAREAPKRGALRAAVEAVAAKTPAQSDSANTVDSRRVGGRAQGIAMKFGKGRVVVLGEAAMFSAQVIRFGEGGRLQERKMGMNVPGNDDKQFALNVVRWLSGLLK